MGSCIFLKGQCPACPTLLTGIVGFNGPARVTVRQQVFPANSLLPTSRACSWRTDDGVAWMHLHAWKPWHVTVSLREGWQETSVQTAQRVVGMHEAKRRHQGRVDGWGDLALQGKLIDSAILWNATLKSEALTSLSHTHTNLLMHKVLKTRVTKSLFQLEDWISYLSVVFSISYFYFFLAAQAQSRDVITHPVGSARSECVHFPSLIVGLLPNQISSLQQRTSTPFWNQSPSLWETIKLLIYNAVTNACAVHSSAPAVRLLLIDMPKKRSLSEHVQSN